MPSISSDRWTIAIAGAQGLPLRCGRNHRRFNHVLRLGNLELDLKVGEMRFRVAQILDEDTLDRVVIDRMIGTTASMLDT
jgi:hypothetical protein